MEATCPICNDAITNPICLHCLEQEMRDWLGDDENATKQLELTTEAFGQILRTDVRCIKCGRQMTVCAHCYSAEVWDIVSKKESFARTFNYDLLPLQY